MRVITNPRRHAATLAVAAGVTLSTVLLALATLGHTAMPDDAATNTAAPASIDDGAGDSGLPEPWIAGDAAVRDALAELGSHRAHETCD